MKKYECDICGSVIDGGGLNTKLSNGVQALLEATITENTIIYDSANRWDVCQSCLIKIQQAAKAICENIRKNKTGGKHENNRT